MPFLRLFLAVLGLAFLGGVLGAGLFWWSSRPVSAERQPIAVTVGTVSLLIPPGYVRAGALPRPGAQDRVDLALVGPDLDAPRPGGPMANVFLALLREDGIIDPAERIDHIYGRFLEPDIWQNPGGLLLRRFAADSPYADEELFISSPDGRAFTARCRKPAAQGQARGGDIGEACLWRFRIGGADAQVRFSPDLLPQWEALSAGIRARIAGWRG
jgi:hypothetical protein